MQEIIRITVNMIPESVVLLQEILQLGHALVDDSSLVALKLIFTHLIERLLKRVEEVLDAAFKIPAVLLALDENTVPSPDIMEARAGEDNVTKLLDGSQLIEARLVCHLPQ